MIRVVMDRGSVQRRVQRAIDRFEDFDEFLLQHQAQEEAISHKIGEYLQQEFPHWNVDCEYNRQNWDLPKRLEGYPADRARPDIIVHQRGPESATGENLLIIEVKANKTKNDGECPSDVDKIKAFIDEKSYEFGLFIDFRKERSEWLMWFSE